MLRYLEIEGKTLHQQKDYDLLHCDTHFIAEVWNHSVSEVCLDWVQMSKGMNFGFIPPRRIWTIGKREWGGVLMRSEHFNTVQVT